MPMERFFRLPEEKQTAIRFAALREFTRVPLERVSINRIIQDADISRGSFYTYFEDKRDLMKYVVDEISGEMRVYCLCVLEESGGDYCLMFDKLLEHCIGHCKNHTGLQLFQNISSVTGLGELIRVAEERDMEMMEAVFCKYNKEKLPIDDFKTFCLFTDVVMALMFQAFGLFIMKQQTQEYVINWFRDRVELVLKGVYSE